MAKRREKIVAGNIYHILNRGVDKRRIFLDDGDYFRFVHDLFEFNDTNPINNLTYRFRNSNAPGTPYAEKPKRELLVDVLAFCLMPNHYHLLVSPRFDDGVFRFLKRLNQGYSQYFNKKYERAGTLFEGRYKSVAIDTEQHFVHIPYYIHLNPLDLIAPEWRKREITDYARTIKFLEDYRWSSHRDYIGKKNFSSVTSRELLLEIFGGSEKYQKEIEGWLKNLEITHIQNFILE